MKVALIKFALLFIIPIAFISCNEKKGSGQTTEDSKKISEETQHSSAPVNGNGTGVVILKENYKSGAIKLFNEDGTEWKSFEFSDDFSDKEISPFALKSENILLVFRCIGKDDQFYNVIVNENQDLSKYIKVSDVNFIYETWEQHVLNVFSIEFDHMNNPIRSDTTNSANEIKFDKEQFYHPVKIKNEWLLIKDDDNKEGWIKWRDDKGKLLINLAYSA